MTQQPNSPADECREAFQAYLKKVGAWKAEHVMSNDGLEIWNTAWGAATATKQKAWQAAQRQPPADDDYIKALEGLKIGDVKLPKGYNITHPNDSHDEAIDKAIALYRSRKGEL